MIWHIELHLFEWCSLQILIKCLQSSHQNPFGNTSLFPHQPIMKCLIKAPPKGLLFLHTEITVNLTHPHLFWYIHTKVSYPTKTMMKKASNTNQAQSNMKHPLMLPSGAKNIVHSHSPDCLSPFHAEMHLYKKQPSQYSK